jgi:hypothetical protein
VHYLLYFPGAHGITGDGALERCGLSDLTRDSAPTWFEPQGPCPDGGRGMCCTWLKGDSSDPPLLLAPSLQWTPCRPAIVPAAGSSIPGGTIDAGAYWVGIDRAHAVGPADIARQELLPGYWVTLGDGNKWHCPAAGFLPHCHGLGPDGIYARQIDPAYRSFWERSQGFAQTILGTLARLGVLQDIQGKKAPQTLSADFDLAETFAFCVEALAFNYRLNAELVTQLGLLKDEGLRSVVKAAVDLPVLLDVESQKKNSLPPVSIPVG